MAYNPLSNDTGGTADDRRSEADRILELLAAYVPLEDMTDKEQEFVDNMQDDRPVSAKQLFWLRDIKDKYL